MLCGVARNRSRPLPQMSLMVVNLEMFRGPSTESHRLDIPTKVVTSNVEMTTLRIEHPSPTYRFVPSPQIGPILKKLAAVPKPSTDAKAFGSPATLTLS